jgi:hypothetical protein
MADEKEFDSRESGRKLSNIAQQAQSLIEGRMTEIMRRYSGKFPTDARDEGLYMDGMRSRLIDLEHAISDFINREF